MEDVKMFTGIITEVGQVIDLRRSGNRLDYTIKCKSLAAKLKIDSSVAIDGVCQSVTKVDKDRVSFQAISVTLEKTNLKNLKIGKNVNLEESLTLQKPIDGHLVYGHVNSTGRIVKKINSTNGMTLEVNHRQDQTAYVMNEGSIAINGVSLTVSKKISNISFQVCVIPLTYSLTSLKDLKISDEVNLEFDAILRANLQVSKDSNLKEVLYNNGYL
jgi:riboflavin synthase